MQELSPRGRRLKTDMDKLIQLATTCSVLELDLGQRGEFQYPESYIIGFQGPSFERTVNPFEYKVSLREHHQVRLTLGPQYPRLMPGLQWLTPIFHPNIAPNGSVCLGGYSTHWAPRLMLDQLCEMLWDMLVFRNFNLDSPYNREAAGWLQQQTTFSLPLCRHGLRYFRRQNESLSQPEGPVENTQRPVGPPDIQFLEESES